MVSTHGYVAAVPPLGSADTGGQVVYVLELAKRLAHLGHAVDLWTRRFDGQSETEMVAPHVRILRMPCGGDRFIPKERLHEHLMEWCEHALRFVQDHRIAYRFINSHYWDGGVAGQRLAEALGVPHIHTPHSLGLWKKRQMETDDPSDAREWEQKFNFEERIRQETIICRSCELVVATTPRQHDMLMEDYNLAPVKVRMIPPGYDDNRFYPVSEASRQMLRHRLGYEGRVVLALGRLADNKGYDLLIEAFTLVAQRIPDAVLHLAVGGIRLDAEERSLLARLRRLVRRRKLGARVRFMGHVSDRQLANHYRAADVFVLSSRYEPFGMTALEAMACGTPTVITTHGGLYRAVTFGRHALYADPFDREDLGICVVKALRHPRLALRLSRMGAHKARSLFAWTGIAQQLIGLVEGRPSLRTLEDSEWDEPWNDGD